MKKRTMPACPNCAARMKPVLADAEPDALRGYRSYVCEPCGYVFSEVAQSRLPDRAMLLDMRAASGLRQ